MSKEKTQGIDYEKIYDIILDCGQYHQPQKFIKNVITKISVLCPFDQALAYFLDGNGKVRNQCLMNIDDDWSMKYLEYYRFVDDSQYGIPRELKDGGDNLSISIRDWNSEPPSREFIQDYIRPRNLKYSIGFSFQDLNGYGRVTIALDRVENVRFTSKELFDLHMVLPPLNHLYKNFHYQDMKRFSTNQISWEETKLTPREIDVTKLLCQGVTPANIGKILFITLPTVYKHISHIYEKMKVSSRQELLVRLLHDTE